MVSAVSSYANAIAARSAGQTAAATTNASTVQTSSSTQSDGNPAVLVSLSAQAQSALKAMAAATAGPYARYFPVRDGFNASALAAAVSNPGAESLSGGKTLDQVAASARQNMNDKYAAMEASGSPFDMNSWEGEDWHTLMGDLDRRALYAVSSNQGGMFTKDEQDVAQSIMNQQQGLAMGLYSGPASEAGTFADPFMGDHAARFKAAVMWLDGVSSDEKTSIAWATNRAAAQVSYEWRVEGEGGVPDNLDSGNPLVKMIKAAMDTMKDNMARGTSTGSIRTADDLKKQPWFKGFESQLDGAIQQTKALYQSTSVAIVA